MRGQLSYWTTCWLACALAAVAISCSPAPRAKTEAVPAPRPVAAKLPELEGSIWKQTCLRCASPAKLVQLGARGRLGYRRERSPRFTYDGTDSWKVEGGLLVLNWSHGYSVGRYSLAGKDPGELKGIKEVYKGIYKGKFFRISLMRIR